MKHVFRVTQMGWEKKKEAVWFDADKYTVEEAIKEFKPFRGITQRGYPYTGYEYDGQKYHDFTYLGVFEDDEIPHDNSGLIDILLKRMQEK